jgi:5'-3' exonuclease
MEDVVDLMATGAKASEVSDRMKELLYAKAAERVDLARPHVANSMFGQEFQPQTEDETESETEVEAEAETEVGDEVEQELETEEDSE